MTGSLPVGNMWLRTAHVHKQAARTDAIISISLRIPQVDAMAYFLGRKPKETRCGAS